MDNVNKCRPIIFLVAICITLVGTVTASEQILTESLVPSKRVSAPPQAHNAPVVHTMAAAQDEFAPQVTTEPSVQTPDHIIDPTAIVAVADSSSQPAVDAFVGSLGGSILVANAATRHDNNMSAVTGDMTQVMDSAINTQEQTADTDIVRFPYAVAVVLVAFLGMVSVIRRDTRKGDSR